MANHLQKYSMHVCNVIFFHHISVGWKSAPLFKKKHYLVDPIFCVKLKNLAENLWKDATRNDRQLCVSCLIVCGFTSHSRIFHSYGDVTIIGEMLQIFTYARHLWQWGFFSVLHLMWHNISIYNGHLRGPVTLTSISKHLAITIMFLRFRSVAAGIRTLNLSHASRTL